MNTRIERLSSQYIENQQITSLEYTAIMPRKRQNGHNRAFDMLATGISLTRIARFFVAPALLFIASLDDTTSQETLSTHPGLGDFGQLRLDRTFK